jgi:hypothetical protein
VALKIVQPGDLITAELMNELIGKVQELERRIADMEVNAPSDGPPAALRLDAQPVTTGTWAVLLGQTLGASKRTLQIRFGDVYVMEYDPLMFTDVAVRFKVPDLAFSEAQKSFPMTVANHRGQAQLDVKVKRPVLPLFPDDLVFNYLGSVPAVPPAGSSATFRVALELEANRPVDLILDASLARDGQASIPITVQDDTGAGLPSSTLSFTGLGTKVVRLPVSQVPAPPFKLVLSARTEGLAPVVFEHPVTDLGDTPDPNVTLSDVTATATRPHQPPKPFAVNDSGDRCDITAPTGTAKVLLEVTATLTSPVKPPDLYVKQSYTWKIEHVAGTPDQWTFDPTSGQRDVDVPEFQATSGVIPLDISPGATPAATATDKSQYRLTVQRTGETRKRTKLLVLSRP